MKSASILFVGMIFVLLANLNAWAQECNAALRPQEIETHTKLEFRNAVKTYFSQHHDNQSESTFGVNIGAIVPVEGYPVPVNLSEDQSNVDRAIDDIISKYESEKHISFESKQKVSFISDSQLKYWNECNKLYYAYLSNEVQFTGLPQGKFVQVDLWLRHNSAPAAIRNIIIHSGSQDLSLRIQKKALLKAIQKREDELKLDDLSHFTFVFQAESVSSDFKLFIDLERYKPITIYYPTLDQTPAADPNAVLRNLQQEIRGYRLIDWNRDLWAKRPRDTKIMGVSDTLDTRFAGKRISYTIVAHTYYKWATYFYRYEVWVNGENVGIIENDGGSDHPHPIGDSEPDPIYGELVVPSNGKVSIEVIVVGFDNKTAQVPFHIVNSSIKCVWKVSNYEFIRNLNLYTTPK